MKDKKLCVRIDAELRKMLDKLRPKYDYNDSVIVRTAIRKLHSEECQLEGQHND